MRRFLCIFAAIAAIFPSSIYAQKSNPLGALKTAVSATQNGINQYIYFTSTSQLILPTIRAKEIAKDIEGQKSLENLFTSFITTYMGENKGKPINLCEAVTIFLVDQYQIAKGAKLADKAVEQLYNQMLFAMVSNADLRNLNDRQKQEIYERLVIEIGITHFMLNSKDGDDEDRNNVRIKASKNLEFLLSAPVDKVTISESGLFIDMPRTNAAPKTIEQAQKDAESYRIKSNLLRMEHETRMVMIGNMRPTPRDDYERRRLNK